MSFLRIKRRNDFGPEIYFQIINFGRHWPRPFKRRSVLQVSLSWNDAPGFPYIQITSGNTGLLGIMLWIYKFGFDLDFMSRTWNFTYLEKLDDET
jgi:hypothetical protein